MLSYTLRSPSKRQSSLLIVHRLPLQHCGTGCQRDFGKCSINPVGRSLPPDPNPPLPYTQSVNINQTNGTINIYGRRLKQAALYML